MQLEFVNNCVKIKKALGQYSKKGTVLRPIPIERIRERFPLPSEVEYNQTKETKCV